jgi:hypothetical protein
VAGLLLILSAAAAALLVATSLRVPSLVSTLLIAYVSFVANLGIVTLALSPFHEVRRGGLAVAELVILAAALAGWWARGRPRPPLTAARAAAREVLRDPLTATFFAVVVVLLAYEALLGTGPPNNMDSLTYHLSRAAAWAQHGGIHWIPNAPEVELTAYQPLAEQQQLFLFAATGWGKLYFLPQYLAQLAILVAVYGSSRRLGFAVRPAACSALLLATFSEFALEAFTAQNDLVAASFPAVAVCLLLGSGGWAEPAFAGATAVFGVGTKLTAGLMLPLLVWLAVVRGRRALVPAVIGGVVGSVTVAMWGYVMNVVHTGHLLGTGTEIVQNRATPSYPGSVANAFDLMYGLMDASVLSSRLIHVLALFGAAAGIAAGVWALRRAGRRQALVDAAGVALPFLAPLLVIGGAAVVAYGAYLWGFPIRGPGGILGPLQDNLNEEYGRIANENYSAYGPVGIVAVVAAGVLAIRAYFQRRADSRQLVLACALPIFLVLVSLDSYWVPFLIRYFMLPAVFAAPLLARLFTGRLTTAAYIAVAALSIGLTITHDQPKPLNSPYGYGRPWNYSWPTALSANSYGYMAPAVAAYEKLVPPHACVGAVLGENEPAYVLFGPDLDHRVVFLSVSNAVTSTVAHDLYFVVISTGPNRWVANKFKAAGWRIRPLGTYWILASYRNAGDGRCDA